MAARYRTMNSAAMRWLAILGLLLVVLATVLLERSIGGGHPGWTALVSELAILGSVVGARSAISRARCGWRRDLR